MRLGRKVGSERALSKEEMEQAGIDFVAGLLRGFYVIAAAVQLSVISGLLP